MASNIDHAPTEPHGLPPVPPPPRRKRHRIRNTLLVLGGLAVIIGVWANATGSYTVRPAGQQHNAAAAPANPAPAPQNSAPAAPAAPAMHATRVTFIVKGDVPSGTYSSVDITYGSDSSTHDVTYNYLDSAGATFSVPFDPNAQYYSVDCNFTGGGHATVKIVVTGPGANPLTVARGSASATDNGTGMAGGLASAQAAPNSSSGTSWTQE